MNLCAVLVRLLSDGHVLQLGPWSQLVVEVLDDVGLSGGCHGHYVLGIV